jgi:hypothetical protein
MRVLGNFKKDALQRAVLVLGTGLAKIEACSCVEQV